jgi:hypothetical protein
MNRPRPNATPSIKAKTMEIGAHVIGDPAISADRIENVQGRVSIVRLKKEKCRSVRADRIDRLRARKIDIGKNDIVHRLRGRCRRSR